ncbi:MAG: tRNA uridine-5-carboxymethylaminomethyl(34) synthesis GTPase MnmE [Desulfitobacteriaceae bacterium]
MKSANRLDDTIVALATALGEAGVHIIRLSGSCSQEIIETCFEPLHKERWNESGNFTLHLGWLKDGNKIIDQVLVGRMSSPLSYTGEDVYEVNCHGGAYIAQGILQVCIRLGARMAEPGEFTKRAFLNGKLDLVQAEAVIDLISSRTEASADLALSQLKGNLSEEIIGLRDQVLEVLAFIEAGIDFPEDDVMDLDRSELERRLNQAYQVAKELLKGSRTGRILREGLMTVIVGRPNVGKSSLLNALVKEERAIVTDVPGTTRDEIREYISIGGILLQLVDTAGIRESVDPVERIGIRRSWQALEKADLILLLIEAGKPLAEEEELILEKYGGRVLVLVNKIDLCPMEVIEQRKKDYGVWLNFSVLKHLGFSELEQEIMKRVFQDKELDQTKPLISNIRQITALERCESSLQQAIEAIRGGYPWDIISIDVRHSLEEISAMTGQDVQESLLEDIFSRFCIGK